MTDFYGLEFPVQTEGQLDIRMREAFASSRNAKPSIVWIVSPYVTHDGMKALLEAPADADRRLITRNSLRDFLFRSSDAECLLALLQAGWRIRYLEGEALHAKLVLGPDYAFVGSANMTRGGLLKNLELTADCEAEDAVKLRRAYRRLWGNPKLGEWDRKLLKSWIRELQSHPLAESAWKLNLDLDAAARGQGSGDRPHSEVPPSDEQIWLIVNGKTERDDTETDLVGLAETHGGQTFASSNKSDPLKGGPTGFQAGDRVFLARMVERDGNKDCVLYGRARIDRKFNPETDRSPGWVVQQALQQAPNIDLERWPFVVWLRDVEVVNGTYQNAAWLSDLDPEGLTTRSHRNGRVRLQGEKQYLAEIFDAALDGLPTNRAAQPTGIWWNDFLIDRVSRWDLERPVS